MNCAVVSPCGTYRYLLHRDLASAGVRGHVLWVMANPSTADAYSDDPTVRRVRGFSLRWGFSSVAIVNVYAFRSFSPASLTAAHRAGIDVRGPHNSWHVMRAARAADRIILAWGKVFSGEHWDESKSLVLRALRQRAPSVPMYALGLTPGGAPRHPLYLSYTAELTEYQEPR